MKRVQLLVILVAAIFFTSFDYAASKQDQLNKISEDLINIKRLLDDGVLDQDTYEKSRKKLLKRKQKLLNKDKPKKAKKAKKRTTQLEKELEVIKKLYDDGLLTKDEYEKTRDLLIEKGEEREEKKLKKLKPYTLNVKSKKGDKKKLGKS